MTQDTDAPTRPQVSERTPSLFGRRRADDRSDLRILSQVERYWRSLIGSRQVPMRADVDPVQLDTALPNTMIVERVAPGMARVRLCGQGINDLMGMDARGMPLSILVTPQSRNLLAERIEAMFAGPAIVEVPLKMPRGWGRKAIPARLLLLPLTDARGLVTRGLAVVVADGEIQDGAAARFEVHREGAFRCTYLPKARPGADLPMESAPERRQNRGRPLPERTDPRREWQAAPALQLIDGSLTDVVFGDAKEPERHPHLRIVAARDV